jgi:hypothetical protein
MIMRYIVITIAIIGIGVLLFRMISIFRKGLNTNFQISGTQLLLFYLLLILSLLSAIERHLSKLGFN